MKEVFINKVKLEELKAEYYQDPDGNSREDQLLTIKTSDCGGGSYKVLETNRWAYDDIEEIVKVLRDFDMRVGVKTIGIDA